MTLQQRCDQIGDHRPDVAFMAPYMAFLLLLAPEGYAPPEWTPVFVAMRGIICLYVAWLFRRHLPQLGAPHFMLAIGVAAFVAWGWVAGQYVADHVGLGGRLPGFPGTKEYVDPRATLGTKGLLWSWWGTRLAVASIAVPVIEEVFWRGFLLRVFINYAQFERVPLGQFTWTSFLVTSLLSAGQHPDNWAVSIPCWFAFNGLFYYTRSLLCLMICHGATNFFLYILTLRIDDWSFI